MTHVDILPRSSGATGWNSIHYRNVGTAVGIGRWGPGAAVAAMFLMLLDNKDKDRHRR